MTRTYLDLINHKRMKNYYFHLIHVILLFSCSVDKLENTYVENYLIVDDEKIDLAEWITPDEEFKGLTGYSIESWIYPKSISIDFSNCDFNGNGFGISLFFISSLPKSIDPGIYVISNDYDISKNSVGGELDFLSKNESFEEDLIGGTLEVIKEQNYFILKLNAVTEKSKKVSLYYQGELRVYSEC